MFSIKLNRQQSEKKPGLKKINLVDSATARSNSIAFNTVLFQTIRKLTLEETVFVDFREKKGG